MKTLRNIHRSRNTSLKLKPSKLSAQQVSFGSSSEIGTGWNTMGGSGMD